jgi:pimeloyl-ACP methyl ester carboxylesterase
MQLKVGELSFYVFETGSAEPDLLFLHYWGGSARTWKDAISRLSSDFRCIAYYQRGWGLSDAPAQGYSITEGIASALHLRRYVLVGHSMGGKVGAVPLFTTA